MSFFMAARLNTLNAARGEKSVVAQLGEARLMTSRLARTLAPPKIANFSTTRNQVLLHQPIMLKTSHGSKQSAD